MGRTVQDSVYRNFYEILTKMPPKPGLDLGLMVIPTFESVQPLSPIGRINNGTYGKHDEDLSDIDPNLPTDALPGSEQKLRVLKARWEAQVPLWHPRDNLGDDD